MKILAKISTILIFLLTFFSFSPLALYGQSEEELPELTLYVSDSCEHCENLLVEFEENGVMEYVTVKEVSSDANLNEFRQVVAECDIRSAVPLLYDGTRCTQGSFGIKEIVFPAAGLEVEDPTPSYQEQQVLSGEEDPKLLETHSTDEVLLNEEETDASDSLAQALGASMDGNVGEPINLSTPTLLIMLIAPAMLLTIAYLLLTKMKI